MNERLGYTVEFLCARLRWSYDITVNSKISSVNACIEWCWKEGTFFFLYNRDLYRRAFPSFVILNLVKWGTNTNILIFSSSPPPLKSHSKLAEATSNQPRKIKFNSAVPFSYSELWNTRVVNVAWYAKLLTFNYKILWFLINCLYDYYRRPLSIFIAVLSKSNKCHNYMLYYLNFHCPLSNLSHILTALAA